MHSESLRDLLIRLTVSQERHVAKAAARALAILGILILGPWLLAITSCA